MAEPSTARAVTRVHRKGLRGIRPRLIGVLLVPTIAALGFGALQMQEAVQESSVAARAESVAAALPATFSLAVQLNVERDAGSVDGIPADTMAQINGATDAAIAEWRSFVPRIDYSGNPQLQADLVAVSQALDGVTDLREQLANPATRLDARTTYTTTLNTLLGLAGRLPELANGSIYRQSFALAEVRPASEALGVERQVVGAALAAGKISTADLAKLARAQSVWARASEVFYQRTSLDARADFDAITAGTTTQGGIGAPMHAAVEKLLTTGDPAELDLTPTEWQAVSADFVGKMERVINTAATDLAADVAESRSAAERSAVIGAVLVFLVLLAALTIAMLAARSIVRPLEQLRRAALTVAHRDLPERVRQIEESDGQVDLTVEPLAIGGHDEIGEVAQAFGAVHAEAVRLAGEQAEMRANVNRMFVNLSRRSQNLVERQLRLIDQLEAKEQDPDHLANLFRLDHLATRMRRNDESLLVLAGGDTATTARGPVPVIDVLRAAASEIEQFARVQVDSTETAQFRGPVAGDLVHLLAELIENATNFSPPDTPVVVRTARGAGSGEVVIEIADLGIGMTPEELAAANLKLQRHAALDADVARMMGLVVTARLAHRHGLSVELVANTPRGVVARVHVPAAALADGTEPAVEAPVQPPTAYAAEPVTPPAPAAPVPPASEAPRVSSTGLPTRSPGATAPPPAAPAAPAARNGASGGENWFGSMGPERGAEDPLNRLLGHYSSHFRGAQPEAAAPEAAAAPAVPAAPAAPVAPAAPAAPVQPAAEPTAPQAPTPAPLPRRDVPDATVVRFPAGERQVLTPPVVERTAASRPVSDPLSAPMEARGEQDESPIYASLQSEWFTRRTPLSARRRADATPTPEPLSDTAVRWTSPGDEGWRRAAELEETKPTVVTANGLPKRVPGQHLIPGAAPAEATTPAAPVVPIARGVDPRRTRGLSSFQQGVNRARSGDLPAVDDNRPEDQQ